MKEIDNEILIDLLQCVTPETYSNNTKKYDAVARRFQAYRLSKSTELNHWEIGKICCLGSGGVHRCISETEYEFKKAKERIIGLKQSLFFPVYKTKTDKIRNSAIYLSNVLDELIPE